MAEKVTQIASLSAKRFN